METKEPLGAYVQRLANKHIEAWVQLIHLLEAEGTESSLRAAFCARGNLFLIQKDYQCANIAITPKTSF